MRTPDEWAKVFAGLPRRKELDKKAAGRRSARMYKLFDIEGKFHPCMASGRATDRSNGRSTWITRDGVMELCQRCSRANRRIESKKKARRARLTERR